MSVIRYKYRRAPVQPELINPQPNASLSAAKKVKPEAVDPYAGIPKISHQQTIYLATHTQQKRVELFVTSDEEAYRRKQYPTIAERVAQQKEWARVQLKEAKMASEREAIKKLMDQKLRKARKESDPTKVDEAAIGEEGVNPDDEIDEIAMIPEDPDTHGPTGPYVSEEDLANESTDIQEDFAAELMDIKERKLLATRNTVAFHRIIGKWERRRFGFRLMFHMLGKRSRELTEVLPWLLIGRRELATNLQTLLRLNITHILNVTSEIPNAFPNHFLYERIPVKDNKEADIAVHFNKIINFLKRVEDCQGRVMVHCTVGASRAPTAVIAYLLIAKTQLGEGCSVYYHPDWRFYEFNVFRGEQLPEREAIGVFKTLRLLYSRPLDEAEDED